MASAAALRKRTFEAIARIFLATRKIEEAGGPKAIDVSKVRSRRTELIDVMRWEAIADWVEKLVASRQSALEAANTVDADVGALVVEALSRRSKDDMVAFAEAKGIPVSQKTKSGILAEIAQFFGVEDTAQEAETVEG